MRVRVASLKCWVVIALFGILLAACQVNAPAATPTNQVTPPSPTANTSLPTTTLPSLTPTVTASQNQPPDLQQALISGVDWYVLVQDALSGQTLTERNSEVPFPPASMIKVPTALSVLSILQEQGRTLEDLKVQGISGRSFDRLLEAMIVRSEESAADALEYFARGDNRLRNKLDSWGLTNTKYDPRSSTAAELLAALRLLDTKAVLNAEFSQYLLDLMGQFSENDQILLGKLTARLPECRFANKRGTMLNPTIAADMGILQCGERSWYLVVAGTPSAGSTATFADIQASIESFAILFADYVTTQLVQP